MTKKGPAFTMTSVESYKRKRGRNGEVVCVVPIRAGEMRHMKGKRVVALSKVPAPVRGRTERRPVLSMTRTEPPRHKRELPPRGPPLILIPVEPPYRRLYRETGDVAKRIFRIIGMGRYGVK